MDSTESPQACFMSRNFDYLFVFDITIDNHEIQKIFKVSLVIVKLLIASTRQNLHEFNTKFGEEGLSGIGVMGIEVVRLRHGSFHSLLR